MKFLYVYQKLPPMIESALHRAGRGGLDDFIALISPLAGKLYLEQLASLSKSLTEQRFGKTIRLFAPLYLSNECNNICVIVALVWTIKFFEKP